VQHSLWKSHDFKSNRVTISWFFFLLTNHNHVNKRAWCILNTLRFNRTELMKDETECWGLVWCAREYWWNVFLAIWIEKSIKELIQKICLNDLFWQESGVETIFVAKLQIDNFEGIKSRGRWVRPRGGEGKFWYSKDAEVFRNIHE